MNLIIIDNRRETMNRILTAPLQGQLRPTLYRTTLRRSSITYRQDMPPPGGYPKMPWRRNLPRRGTSYIVTLIAMYCKLTRRPLMV